MLPSKLMPCCNPKLYLYRVGVQPTFVTTAYDLLGRMASKTDQAGISTWYEYNALNRLVAVSNALGHVTRYAYDEMRNQTAQVDANGHITLYEYDNRGRRIKRTLPERQVETYGYDAAGNMTNKVDFNGNAITYEYDAMNRLLAKHGEVPSPTTVSYTYDDRGNRSSMTDAHGTTTYDYDERDRLLSKATPIG
ncbi:MAG: RHS repeat protein, partial [Gammaproteobacteria bacterium]|nr:RHS repeat protein [Gammaproteobacteria bacterium]